MAKSPTRLYHQHPALTEPKYIGIVTQNPTVIANNVQNEEIKSKCKNDQICPWHDAKTPCTNAVNDFGKIAQEYFDSLANVAKLIMSGFAEGLGKEKSFFDPYFNYHATTLRLNYYPKMSETHLKGEKDETPLACGEHADTGIITILLQDEVGGLEVYDNISESWISVPPKKDAFVVNLGNLFVKWVNSKFKAGLHRVRFTPNTDRISIPFFYCPNYGAQIDPMFYNSKNEDNNNTSTIKGNQEEGENGVFSLIYGPWCVEQMKRFKEYDPDRMLQKV